MHRSNIINAMESLTAFVGTGVPGVLTATGVISATGGLAIGAIAALGSVTVATRVIKARKALAEQNENEPYNYVFKAQRSLKPRPFSYGDRILVLNEDAADLLKNLHEYTDNEPCFVYADPPYYLKGRELYLSHYSDSDHETFAKLIRKGKRYSWIVSYDDVPRIRELYLGEQIISFDLRYSAHKASSKGHEILIAPSHVNITNLTRALLTTRAGSKA